MEILWVHYMLLTLFSRTVWARNDLNGTVTGCDGHPCSTGEPNILPLTSDQEEAILLARCQAKCLDTVSELSQEKTNLRYLTLLFNVLCSTVSKNSKIQ